MSNPQTQGSQAPGQPQQQQMLKPDDLPKLQSLNEDQKQKYRPVLANFWQLIQTKAPNSPEHQQARAKLAEWSSKLIQQERTFRAKKAQGQTLQQGQPPQQSNLGTQAQPAKDAQQASPQPAQLREQQGSQQAQPVQTGGQQAARPSGQQNAQNQINPEIIRHVQNFTYHLPPQGPQAGTPEGDQKLKELRNSYLMALNKQEKSTHRVKGYQSLIDQRKQSGSDVPQELYNQKQQAEQEYGNAKRYVEEFRKRQSQWKTEHEQRRAQQQQGQQPQAPAQPPSQPGQQSQQNVVKQEPQIKVEGGQQPAQQFSNIPPSGGAQQQQQIPISQAQAASMAQPLARQPPTPQAPQFQQPNQAPSFAQPGQPQAHQPPRPQINPQQANAQHHQQTNSPHPQSATSNPAGPPVPLSHQAAVSAAQRSYSNPDAQRTATPMQPGHGSFHASGSREREQLNNPKMPIPRTLNVSTPQPVQMGQARPTMSGPTNGAPGPMGQPVITKFPQFQLEGEGDRVLSKRKLDELVRQVTGGSEDALTPEVEEVVLQLADDFVDTVISNACKLSKLRESPQLDIRDIQLVLERNYNIRIPGYASDEIRTVRKLVPAAGWTQKMNAVQAAKVMGGKTDI
ncbi:hypothetical protein CC78DRAFT_565346 [Lojkania enalia]|uniref:Transcription initiation factor TFIID subunit 12 domain-containing protein n=1 Tax=Lojkania enalia TaxID=147567 RepID=A0A9P4KJK2_9PLEO|nr:hypothetical protein CC78DRAFT_565346 [Didymosphaeria enalia]